MVSEHWVTERIHQLVAEIRELDRENVHGTSRLREDLGMDSLSSLELLSAISEEARVDLPIEDAMSLETVDDACAFVLAAVRAAERESDRDVRASA